MWSKDPLQKSLHFKIPIKMIIFRTSDYTYHTHIPTHSKKSWYERSSRKILKGLKEFHSIFYLSDFWLFCNICSLVNRIMMFSFKIILFIYTLSYSPYLVQAHLQFIIFIIYKWRKMEIKFIVALPTPVLYPENCCQSICMSIFIINIFWNLTVI